MPKFYKQNKKRTNPRYFLNETIEEAVIEPGLTKGGQWPGISNQDRARSLAQQGMKNAGEVPPWESEDEEGDGFTDASLDERDFEVLNWILKDLRTGTGRGNMGDLFLSIMEKLGIALEEPQGSSAEGEAFDIEGDEMEDKLGKFRDAAEEEDKIRKSVLGSMAKNPPSTPWSKGR